MIRLCFTDASLVASTSVEGRRTNPGPHAPRGAREGVAAERAPGWMDELVAIDATVADPVTGNVVLQAETCLPQFCTGGIAPPVTYTLHLDPVAFAPT